MSYIYIYIYTAVGDQLRIHIDGETAFNCIGPEWASVGPRLGPIKSDDLQKASKNGMPKVCLFWLYRKSNQHPIIGVPQLVIAIIDDRTAGVGK